MGSYADISLSTGALKAFYNSHFLYYTTLNSQWQEIFVLRCEQLISDKLIIGAEDFEPDNKVKAIIAASAVQLTLGLDDWKLDYFDTVIIHPGDFDNRASGRKYRGETNMGGYIRLSWQSFISGYKIRDDNINLGLHEFSHALRFNSIRGAAQDYFLEHYLTRWFAAAGEAYNDLKTGRETIFRKYGGANINEFMSVCIEHFFESPQEIKESYPMLYYSTALLLNQETQDNITTVNIRNRLFDEQALLHKPVGNYIFKTVFYQTYSFISACALTIPLLFVLSQTGFSSGSLTLFCLLVLCYLIFDFNYTNVKFNLNQIIIAKGFFVFRNRRKISISLPCLISLKMNKTLKNVYECEVVYYNPGRQFFYREDVLFKGSGAHLLQKELRENRVPVFIK